jgi:hypothetical protein
LKKPSQKKAGGVVQGTGPEFKSQYHKKIKLYYSRLKSRLQTWAVKNRT